MLTQDPAATATFKFTGSDYIKSHRNRRFNFASSRPDAGQGPETVQSHVIWSSDQLSNTEHTLIISVGAGEPYAVVDALVFTALDPSDVTSSASASSAASTLSSTQAISISSSSSTAAVAAATSASVDESNSTHVVPIALGTVFGVLALLLIILGIWFWLRRKRRPVSEAWSVPGTPYPGSPPVSAVKSNVPLIEASGSEYAPAGIHPAYDNSWGGGAALGLIPGAMSPAVAASYAQSYGTAAPTTDHPQDDGWQGTTAQIAQRYMRSPNRYQPNTLSTITETSPQGSPLANSPGSGDLSNDSGGINATPENREPPFPVLKSDRPPAYTQ
ncbi:hypothetical protein C0992_009021 [Termitomyces sp. T32_za158]|nr:hypothetical protein C0992_009021 [Termitomyces sp. T32_za158]